MKNLIPLVLAVVLGLAAVFGVRHVLAERNTVQTAMEAIVAAAQDIPLNAVLTDSAFVRREVPRSALPAKAVPWEQRELLVKQKTLRMIPRGDYVQWSDVGSAGGVSDLIGEGEWAISVPFADSAIAASLRPGDEIAIVGSFSALLPSEGDTVQIDGIAPEVQRRSRITTTILPRVRIISIGAGNTIVLSLTPQQAQLLIDAQRVASLYPALRRPNDERNLDRLKTGMVDSVTYDKLLNGQQRIELPAVPDGAGR